MRSPPLDPRRPIGDALAEGLLAHGMGSPLARGEQAAALLAAVGLSPDSLNRYPHEFSGGERQRITLARALALEPLLIILDEAVSALDVSIQAEILNLLLDLQTRLGLSYLFISHDLFVVERMSDTIGVLHQGRLVECGPAANVLSNPRHPQTRALLQAAREISPAS